MSRRRPAEEGLLFDLPLDTTRGEAAPAEEPPSDEQPDLPLAEQAAAPAPPAEVDSHEAADRPEAAPPRPPRRSRPATAPAAASLGRRAAAGLADLGVCAAVLVVLVVVLLAQGVRPVAADWPAGLLFLLAFSFLYAVLPLAFWSRTPGMALAGLETTGHDGRPLTFRQAVLTWLGAVLTMALAGLPLLLALGGRSLSDRLSGSTTRCQ